MVLMLKVLLRWTAKTYLLAGQGCKWCCFVNPMNLTMPTPYVFLVEGAMARETSLESRRSIALLVRMGLGWVCNRPEEQDEKI